MARGKKKESTLTPEEKLAQALVPDWEQSYKVPGNWCWAKIGALSEFERGITFPASARVYLKTPNAPGQRTFSRCAAPFFLEIRQYSCEKMSCSAQKFLAAGHIGSFQIHPKLRAAGRLYAGPCHVQCEPPQNCGLPARLRRDRGKGACKICDELQKTDFLDHPSGRCRLRRPGRLLSDESDRLPI